MGAFAKNNGVEMRTEMRNKTMKGRTTKSRLAKKGMSEEFVIMLIIGLVLIFITLYYLYAKFSPNASDALRFFFGRG
jgi:hypothetical protein